MCNLLEICRVEFGYDRRKVPPLYGNNDPLQNSIHIQKPDKFLWVILLRMSKIYCLTLQESLYNFIWFYDDRKAVPFTGH